MIDELNMDCQDVEKFYPHCGNEKLYERLDEAIERGEITEEEARQIYKNESE